MITPSFGLTATERVLPRMALDFTTASLDSRVTFTRTGNTATVTNSSGYVVGINANLPRFDFDPIALTCKGLLIEESRINIVLYSQNFSTFWSQINLTVQANATTSPANVVNANKIIANTVNNVHFVRQFITYAANTSYAFSVYAKKAEQSFIRVDCFIGGVGGVTFYANLNTGATSTSSGTWTVGSASATLVGNGWYKCTFILTTGAVGGVGIMDIGGTTGLGVVTYAGNDVDGIFVWGAQLEVGAFLTSYIPTEATTVTRNADVAVMTSTNFSYWYTATTGAASVWATPQTATGTRPLIQFDDTTANEIITLRGNVANPELYIVDGGAPQAQIDTGTIVANTVYKLSGAWNTDSCAAAQNGAAAVTDNTATIPTPTQLRIGSDGTNYASAWVQKIMYYPQRIINAEVQAFSK